MDTSVLGSSSFFTGQEVKQRVVNKFNYQDSLIEIINRQQIQQSIWDSLIVPF